MGNKNTRIFVRVPDELADEIRALAKKEYLTLSAYVRKLMIEACIRSRRGEQ